MPCIIPRRSRRMICRWSGCHGDHAHQREAQHATAHTSPTTRTSRVITSIKFKANQGESKYIKFINNMNITINKYNIIIYLEFFFLFSFVHER